MKNNKRMFRKQKNGRERGLPGMGDGTHQETSPMGHATKTKSKGAKRRKGDRWDRKAKHRGNWRDAA